MLIGRAGPQLPLTSRFLHSLTSSVPLLSLCCPCPQQGSVCFLPADDIRAEQQIMCSRGLRWQRCVRHPLIKSVGKVELKVLHLKRKRSYLRNVINDKSHIMFPWKKNKKIKKNFYLSLPTVPCSCLLSHWPLPLWEPTASLFMK